MHSRWIRRLTGGAGLLAAFWMTASTTESLARDAIPESVVQGLIEKDVAYLQKSLTKMPEKRAQPTVKATAMILAQLAQNQGNGALRDQALKVAEALAKKDFAGAKSAADKLTGLKGGSSDKKKLETMHEFELYELMSVFRNSTVGGLNMEKDIRLQGRNLTDPKLAGELGARAAVIAEYTVLMPTSDAEGAKKKQWEDWSKEMGTIGSELAVEAGKGASADKAILVKKLKALDANCTACHNVFRN